MSDWLSRALDAPVEGVDVEPLDVAGAFCTLERWTISPGGQTVIAKLPREGEIRAVGQGLGLYERERAFYRDMAEEIAMRTPRCLHLGDGDAATEPMLLEDLSGLRSGDQIEGLSPSEAAALLAEAAGLHAAYWEQDGHEWLMEFDNPVNVAVLEQVMAGGIPAMRKRFAGRFRDATLDAAAGVCGRIGDVLRACNAGPRTVTHGDFRLDNVLFDGDEAVYLDWQTPARARGTHDVAYLLSGSLQPGVLAEHWEELLRGYHERLIDGGVSGYGWDDCVAHYRQNVLYSFVPALATLGAVAVEGERGASLADAIGERVLSHAEGIDAFSTVPWMAT